MDLVEITRQEFDITFEIAYGSADNFTARPVYSRPACYLRREAADALGRACEAAAALGLSFRIYDAFRPTEAQWVLWNHTPDPDFLADPRRGSPHSRGVAIDLTLIDGDGNALEMGTGFDEFTPLSHHGSTGVPATAQRNRLMLLGLMTQAGWDFYRNEWWHYQLFDSRSFALISDGELPEPMM